MNRNGFVVKICGITNAEDAAAAVEAGATAIGFNFYPRSPRYVTPETAAALVTNASVQRVGVFVNEAPARIEEIARIARLDIAQLHGDEPAADYPREIIVWKAVRAGDGMVLASFVDCPAAALVVDGPAGELYGGAGKAFDWRRAAILDKRVILGGGLDAANVAEAIALARPWGVDACSRLEAAPGKKDHRKMTEFVAAARAALNA